MSNRDEHKEEPQYEIVIEMPYIGACLSVNHYKYRGRYTKRETKDWMEELGWKIKPYHLELWQLPLIVKCGGIFRDKRSQPDLSNLSKVILDAIEDTTGINDRDMRWRDGVVSYGVDPKLIILIGESVGIDEQKYLPDTSLLTQLMKRCKGLCEECGKPPDWRGLAPHHIKFRSQGGKDTYNNLKMLCGKCHSKAHGIKEV